MNLIRRPSNFAEVLKTFGDITRYIRRDGTLNPAWEEENIVRLPLPSPVPYAFGGAKITRVTVHRKLVDQLECVHREIWDEGLVDELGPYGGGYVFRPIRGAHTLSLHSFGIAFDWSPVRYPLGSIEVRHPKLLEIWSRYGFVNGAEFQGRKDPQHWQYATGC